MTTVEAYSAKYFKILSLVVAFLVKIVECRQNGMIAKWSQQHKYLFLNNVFCGIVFIEKASPLNTSSCHVLQTLMILL